MLPLNRQPTTTSEPTTVSSAAPPAPHSLSVNSQAMKRGAPVKPNHAPPLFAEKLLMKRQLRKVELPSSTAPPFSCTVNPSRMVNPSTTAVSSVVPPLTIAFVP